MRLTVITRRDCHLCDEMLAVIAAVAPAFGGDLEVRDVDDDPELRARYSEQVPVLLIDGRKAFKYRVSAAALTHRMRLERHRQTMRRWRDRLLGRST